ncbi:WD40 repeat-like protein [Saccharata proteae CBS 121410]|uniref:Probable cytosolic iron-sulfur protein assembly protein 1 n=1 Tax=Saccharata proteae CBS 121410 TaxID=1314787 RepID=A0A9P4HN41_9PEZI|nr:WD40 repeat-like protein [Saccharata proteae CBS 121410]
MATSITPPTLRQLATLQPPSSARAWFSAPHPTLPIVATASSDKTVRIYSLTSFTLLSTIGGGHKRSIRSCAWKPGVRGESVLATGSFDASAGIWRKYERGPGMHDDGAEDGDADDDEDWRFSVILDGHESEIKSLAWSAGGQFLATCSRDKSVWIWEEMEDDNFETIAVLQEHEGDVKCVAWHPNEDLLASASYDDTIRLYREDLDDWGCVAVLNGHDATVWSVDFELLEVSQLKLDEGTRGEMAEKQGKLLRDRVRAGPRLASSSDDLSIRIWRRVPKNDENTASKSGMPSILRTNSIEEEWVEEARLPQRHERAVYSVAWSKKSGLIASAGSDGMIVVYKEQWRDAASIALAETSNGEETEKQETSQAEPPLTEWVVVAEVEGAHDVFEINNVCWAKRGDKGRRREDEEVILSTGDDGEVKVWVVD